jgi:hypothetical protein
VDLHLALFIRQQQPGSDEIDSVIIGREPPDPLGVFLQNSAVISLHMANPIFRRLFVYVMMAALTWQGMGHQYELATGERLEKVLQVLFINVLHDLLAVDQIH